MMCMVGMRCIDVTHVGCSVEQQQLGVRIFDRAALRSVLQPQRRRAARVQRGRDEAGRRDGSARGVPEGELVETPLRLPY